MAEVVDILRKANILGRPALPCLSSYHTINLIAGCPYQCLYCYAQNFRSHPGKGRVPFYANAVSLLRDEMARKRTKPALVYFSTACEPFVPIPKVLASLYEAMRLLLDHSVFLLISTKSKIPETFLRLFAQYPGRIHVQVGLTTADDRVRRLLEPNAATIMERLDALQSLADHGIRAEARIDPLVPELTDTERSFASLCSQISQTNTKTAVASYLFLRASNYRRLAIHHDDWSFREMSKRLYTHKIEKYCGSGDILIPSTDYRNRKYTELIRIAKNHGIRLSLCRCKNPDLAAECCHPHPPANDDTGQAELFPE